MSDAHIPQPDGAPEFTIPSNEDLAAELGVDKAVLDGLTWYVTAQQEFEGSGAPVSVDDLAEVVDRHTGHDRTSDAAKKVLGGDDPWDDEEPIAPELLQ